MSTHRPRGFSLIEMMIAMALSLMLLVGIAAITVSHSTSARELDRSSRQIESGRYALQVIGNDVMLAGFYGTFAPSGATIAIADPCATAVGALGFDNSTTPVTLAAPVYGYGGASAAPACLTNRLAGTGIVVLRRVSSTATTTAAAVAGQVYVQTTGCTNDPKPFVIDAAGGGFSLTQKDCAAAAPLRGYVVRTYYVSSCNVCSGTGVDTTPTLKVAELVNGAIAITPLAEGIQDLQADYGVDVDGNGSADCYVADPGIDHSADCAGWTAAPGWSAANQNWGNVSTVLVHVLARNTEQTADWTDTRTYDMGKAGLEGPFSDRYKRHVYAAVLRINNVAGLRE